VRLAIGRASDFFGPGVLDSACGDRMFLPAVQGKAAEAGGTWMRLTPTPSSTNSVRVWSSSESATKPSDRPGTFQCRDGQHPPLIELIFEDLGQPARSNQWDA